MPEETKLSNQVLGYFNILKTIEITYDMLNGKHWKTQREDCCYPKILSTIWGFSGYGGHEAHLFDAQNKTDEKYKEDIEEDGM